MTATHGPVAYVWLAEDERPRLLLDAWVRGLYAAQTGYRTANPYRDDEAMADAWRKGWESAGHV